MSKKTTADTAQEQTATVEKTVEQVIEETQKSLEIELERLQKKSAMAKHRERFINVKKQLKDVYARLNGEQVFESESVILTFKASSGDRYSKDELFSINNKMLLLKFIDVLTSEIDLKISVLETELVSL